jgi:N-ethylmaleimide reductase
MPDYPEIFSTYAMLADRLSKAGIAYIHLVDHADMGAPEVPVEIKKFIRSNFKNTLILSGGYDLERAEADLASGYTDYLLHATSGE